MLLNIIQGFFKITLRCKIENKEIGKVYNKVGNI